MRRDEVEKALSFYRDLNQLAFEKVARGGLVVTCSCTGMVSLQAFLGALSEAAARATRSVRFLEVAGAPPDHPVPADFPQAAYLKRVLCHVV
jgi:23S rRNA (cytosine1962-C5)-methyltransferase